MHVDCLSSAIGGFDIDAGIQEQRKLMTDPGPKTERRLIDRLSTVALVVAVVVAGYVAYSTRPWDRSAGQVDTSSPLGLIGGDASAPRPGETAPDFALLREDGSTLRLSDLQGRPVFLNFWATWCTFCIEEMPDMQRIADEFDGQIVVLGLNTGDSIPDGAAYAERLDVHYELVYDTDLQVTEGYRVRAMPTSYFIDSSGQISDAHFGFMTYDDMREKVESLLDVEGSGSR
jgi:peroxiredoxin